MRVTILGSGTSCGVPTLGCKCAVCTSPNPRNKRMRSSAYIEEAGQRILIDCGPDFRTQALANCVEDIDFVLITHSHADHISGLDDLRAFNMVHKHAVGLYAARDTLEDVRTRFAYCFAPPPPGGGIPELRTYSVGSEIRVNGVRIQPVPVLHGAAPILGYRFERFAYLTDVSAIPESSFDILRGVDVLVTSALRPASHPTHMSLSEALEVASRVGAGLTFFIHMNHDLDHDATNAGLPANVQLAYDGLSFEV